MKIYTKSGDKGETSLFGGQRVLKNCNRINAYGTVDELNSFLGAALSEIKTTELKEVLLSIQNNLFTLGGDLATPIDQTNKNVVIQRINEKNIFELEHLIDKYDEKLPEHTKFYFTWRYKRRRSFTCCTLRLQKGRKGSCNFIENRSH
jgi:cob(I)alamin adenosyltransferase